MSQGVLFGEEPGPKKRAGSKRWTGADSRAARAIVRAMLPAACWRCGKPLTEADDWTAGHITDRMDGGDNGAGNLAPECGACNYRAGGKRGAAITNLRHTAAVDIQRVRRDKWW